MSDTGKIGRAPVQLLQIIVGHPERLLGAAVIIGCDSVAVIKKSGIDVTVDMAGTEKHDINAVFRLPVQTLLLIDTMTGLYLQYAGKQVQGYQKQQDKEKTQDIFGTTKLHKAPF